MQVNLGDGKPIYGTCDNFWMVFFGGNTVKTEHYLKNICKFTKTLY